MASKLLRKEMAVASIRNRVDSGTLASLSGIQNTNLVHQLSEPTVSGSSA